MTLAKNFSKHSFDTIAKTEWWVEYRYWRDIAPLLWYNTRENFKKVVEKAELSINNSWWVSNDHIIHIDRETTMPKGWVRITPNYNYKLTRYACYLIAQNGDPRKKEIAEAQSYFAIQTRRSELHQQLEQDKMRIQIRNEVVDQNKKLFKTAEEHWVSNFWKFNDAWYKGLYGMRNKEIIAHKNLWKDALLDRSDSTELAANLFRITQTQDKLKQDKVNTQKDAEQVHFIVWGKVRKAIKDIGGVMPESIPPTEHIKEVKKRIKKTEKLIHQDNLPAITDTEEASAL